jgi:hypothetical protein
MRLIKLAVPAGAMLLLLAFVMTESKGGHFVVLREGTPVVIKLAQDFDAAALKEGEKVPMVVVEKVTNEGAIVINAGSLVVATFTPGEIKGSGLLNVSSVQAADGQDVMLRATPEAQNMVENMDAAGQLTINAPAENQRIPAGTTFRVYLSDTYLIED